VEEKILVKNYLDLQHFERERERERGEREREEALNRVEKKMKFTICW
jgi:hypothetical protein